MSSRTCDACGEPFETLTRLRLHEKDDCPGRQMYADIDTESPDAGEKGAEGLLTCRDCGRTDPDADYDQSTSFAGGDYHMIVEFSCRYCGFDNENRIVMEGVDRGSLDQLPPRLQPDEVGEA